MPHKKLSRPPRTQKERKRQKAYHDRAVKREQVSTIVTPMRKKTGRTKR